MAEDWLVMWISVGFLCLCVCWNLITGSYDLHSSQNRSSWLAISSKCTSNLPFFSFLFLLLLLLQDLSPCLNICLFLNISLSFKCRLPCVALYGVCHCWKRWWNISARAWFLKPMQNFSSPQETLLSYFTKLNHISMNPIWCKTNQL